MSILVLDVERDPVWNIGDLIDEKYLNAVRLSNKIHNDDITRIEFDDGMILQCAVIKGCIIVASKEVNVNAFIMRIKDIIGDEAFDSNAEVAKVISIAQSGQHLNRVTTKKEVIIQETITDSMRGILKGKVNGRVFVRNASNYFIKVRPNTKLVQEKEDLYIDLITDYDEQIQYTSPHSILPCTVERLIAGNQVTLKISNELEAIDLQDIILRIPMIKAVEKKELSPNSLLHKCLVDAEKGISWFISFLRPKTCVTLNLSMLDQVHERIEGDLTLQYCTTHPDFSIDSKPIMVQRIYNRAPWF